MGKLRWERSKGVGFNLANGISAEDVNQQWEAIVGFTDADHPANGQEAMMAMMQNLQNR